VPKNQLEDALRASDGQGFTPLTYCCREGKPALAVALLAAGADPNTAGGNGLSPLLGAIKAGSVPLVAALVHGAVDVNAVAHDPSGGCGDLTTFCPPSPLQLTWPLRRISASPALLAACVYRNPAIVTLLLEHGANPLAQDADGEVGVPLFFFRKPAWRALAVTTTALGPDGAAHGRPGRMPRQRYRAGGGEPLCGGCPLPNASANAPLWRLQTQPY
jgi:hypothetical protein